MVDRAGEWFSFSSNLFCRRITLYNTLAWSHPTASPSRRPVDADSSKTFCGVQPLLHPSFPSCLCSSAAPFGGPVALVVPSNVPDEGSLGGYPSENGDGFGLDRTESFQAMGQSMPPLIHVFSSGGDAIAVFRVPADVGSVLAVGWTKEETLLVLTTYHCCILFSLSAGAAALKTGQIEDGTRYTQLLRLVESSSSPDSDARSKEPPPTTAVIARIKAGGVVYADDRGVLRGVVTEERRKPLLMNAVSTARDGAGLNAIDFLAAEQNDDGEMYVYLATRPERYDGKSVVSIINFSSGNGNAQAKQFTPTEVTTMELSTDGDSLAVYTRDATLYIFESNLSSIRYAVNLGARGKRPVSLNWCGTSCVLVNFNAASFDTFAFSESECPMFSLLVPVIPGQSLRCERLDWDLDGSGHIITATESDGVRVITEQRCYFIEEVAPCLSNLCRMSPIGASASFVRAYQECATGGARSVVRVHAMLGRLANKLTEVVEELIDAAAHEFDIERQYRILTAASFANEFCRQYDPETFVDVVRRLRMLHAVRNEGSCHVPLSIRQYAALSAADKMRPFVAGEAQVLIDRLTNRCEFQLALDVARITKSKTARVLVSWACYKVRLPSLPDSMVAHQIRDVLTRSEGATFTEAALVAYQFGRHKLAVELLRDEPRAHSKTLLLLRMKENEHALMTALKSNDMNLIYLVLSRLMEDSSKTVARGYEDGEGIRESDRELFGVLLRCKGILPVVFLSSIEVLWWRDVLHRLFCGQGPADVVSARPFAMYYLVRTLLGDTMDEQQRALKQQLASWDVAALPTVYPGKPSSSVMSVNTNFGEEDPDFDPSLNSTLNFSTGDSALESLATPASSSPPSNYRGLGSTASLAGLTPRVVDRSEADARITPEHVERICDWLKVTADTALTCNTRSNDDAAGISKRASLYDDTGSNVSTSTQTALSNEQPSAAHKLGNKGSLFALFGSTAASIKEAHAVDMQDIKWLRQHSELIPLRKTLSLEVGTSLTSSSVADAIYQCCLRGQDKRATELRSKFSVSDRLFCFTQLRAYCDSQMWDRVDRLGGFSTSTTKDGAVETFTGPRPCIGFSPFVDLLERCNRNAQAGKFVSKMEKIEARIERYVSLGLFRRAIDDAAKEEDPDLIAQIMSRTTDESVISYGRSRQREFGGA